MVSCSFVHLCCVIPHFDLNDFPTLFLMKNYDNTTFSYYRHSELYWAPSVSKLQIAVFDIPRVICKIRAGYTNPFRIIHTPDWI